MYRTALGFLLSVCALTAQSPTATPLEWQERWDSYVDRTFNWKRIGMVAAETAFDDTFRFSKCGRPPYCFPHHLGGALVRRTTRTSMEFGIGALLHEDLRHRQSGLTNVRRRAVFALVHAPLSISPDGKWGPAYSRYAGTLSAVAVYSVWDGRPLNAGTLFGRAGWTATSYFQDALFTEFGPDLKRFGKRFVDRHFQNSRIRGLIDPTRYGDAPAPVARSISP